MADILDKNFKITILKMLKKLKEDVKKVKKMMCKQNENNATNFRMLTLYSATLMNSFIHLSPRNSKDD